MYLCPEEESRVAWKRGQHRAQEFKVESYESVYEDFPGGPVVKNPPMQCRGHGFNPWSRRIPHATGQLSPCTATGGPVISSL